MNILTDKDAFIVSNMALNESDHPHMPIWSVHDTFEASGVEVLMLTAFSYDDEDCRYDFTINKDKGYASNRTPSLKELKKLLDEVLNRIPKHVLEY